MIRFGLAIGLAFVLFFCMFSPWTAPHVNFWLLMSFSACFLSGLAYQHQPKQLKALFVFKKQDLLIGVLSAVLLYGFFYVGRTLVTYVLSFSGSEIHSIYTRKTGTSLTMISLLLLFLIGPAEEIFWRGYVQTYWARQKNAFHGYLFASLIYAGVHIWSFNLTLLLASLICGLFWGYLFFRYQRLWPVIISHALWDVTIFVLFPLG